MGSVSYVTDSRSYFARLDFGPEASSSPHAADRPGSGLLGFRRPRCLGCAGAGLGKAVKTGKGCKASKRVKVTSKSVFRTVLIDSTNQATLAYSPKVTVKLK